MNNADEKHAAAPAPTSSQAEYKKIGVPATGAVVGTTMIVLMVELARTGALEQYKDLLAPLFAWGPGLLIVMGFFWLMHNYAPPLIESHRAFAMSLQKLADTVEHSAGSQHDLVLAMQVNSDKLEHLRTAVTESHDFVLRFREECLNARKQCT